MNFLILNCKIFFLLLTYFPDFYLDVGMKIVLKVLNTYKMKKIILFFLGLLLNYFQAQTIKEITLIDNSKNAIINLQIGNMDISMDTNGNILSLNEENFSVEPPFKVVNHKKSGNLNCYGGNNLQTTSDAEFDYDESNSKNGVRLKSNGDFSIAYYDDFYKYQSGKIKSIANTTFSYYDDFYNYRVGKLQSVGNTKFDYFDEFYSYQTGKLKSIDNLNFNYHDNFYSYKVGKLQSVGTMKIEYFDDFYKYQTGKIKSIGNINFEYYDDFYNYRTGKIKSIKGNKNHTLITIIN